MTSSGSGVSTTDSTTTVMSTGSAEMINSFETQSQLFALLQPLGMFEGQGDGDDSQFGLWLERKGPNWLNGQTRPSCVS